MNLEKNQIQRYLRHIIMPEISGSGQKKLLESRVVVYCESVKLLEPIAYYMAACGVGHISCYVDNMEDCQTFVDNIADLNSDISLKINDFKLIKKSNYPINLIDNSFDLRILLGDCECIANYWDYLKNEDDNSFVSTVIACINNWSGIIQVCENKENLNLIMQIIEDRFSKIPVTSLKLKSKLKGYVLANCILGSIAVIEGIKIILNIGKIDEQPLYINLLSLEFKRIISEELGQYFSNLGDASKDGGEVPNNEDIHNTIKNAKVLVIGAGGLGSPVAYALAAAGIGSLGFVDGDIVEISNLNRQILHSTSRIGIPKVKSAEETIKRLNPEVEVLTYNTRFNEGNALEFIKDYDLIVDAVDNLASRYVLNKACQSAKKPFIEAGVVRFYGQIMTFIPGSGPCYSCIFPNEEALSNTMTCAEAGVLGVIPGLIGFIQAAEAIKVITHMGDTLNGKILFLDALDSEFSIFNFNKNSNCIVCEMDKGM